MTRQKPLFENKELRLRLRKLTEAEIEEIGLQAFGNLYYYHPNEIKMLVELVRKKLHRKKP